MATSPQKAVNHFEAATHAGVGRVAFDDVPVKINRGAGAERVEFGGLGRQGGGKKRRDEQADDAVRQLLEDKCDEHIIGVVRRRAGIGRRQGFFSRRAYFLALLLRRSRLGKGHPGAGFVAMVSGVQPVFDLLARLVVGVLKATFERLQLSAGVVLREILMRGRIEQQRRLLKLIEDKNQDAEQQDGKLHRDFAHGIEHQPQPAFAQRCAGKIALHLRLVGAEIGQHQKRPAEQSRPESVTLGECWWKNSPH